jgi:hypothetical protein
MEGPIRPIASPEDELAYLRAEVARKEAELASMKRERPREEIAHEQILHHRMSGNEDVLAPGYRMSERDAETHALSLNLDPAYTDETIAELKGVMEAKGIHNAFAILEKLKNPHLEDDFHRFLVQYLLAGMRPKGLSESQPEWKALSMALYEISLPEAATDEARNRSLKELISSMEQFYAGMLAVGQGGRGEPAYLTLELAVPVDHASLMFYAAVPNSRRDLFEKQLLAIFPNAHLSVQPNDYNVFVDGGTALASVATLKDKPMLPLKDYQDFDYDPLNSILNAFAKIAPEDEGAALQIVFKPEGNRYLEHYRRVLHALKQGEHRSRAFSLPETFVGDLAREAAGLFFTPKRQAKAEPVDEKAVEMLEKKMATPVASANIRLVASSQDPVRAHRILDDLEAAFNQFENTAGNRLEWKRPQKGSLKQLLRDFSFRLYRAGLALPLSLRELTTIFHFPPNGIDSSPHLKQARSAQAAAPADLPREGLSLGTNTFRGHETAVRLSPEDRLRHLYVIGQTGTGKTGFLKTLIAQDVRAGNGVCFIDPHGNDILDVLAMIPPERYEDVIYFDPAHLDGPFGLNLLEYDPAHPEQKTFIVNELLAIFRRLYGDVPESMGPAFEQYFRNATLLVMEDPASGSTLMDIARVLSDAPYRNLKLARSNNPVVNQFWTQIATQAGGEASLENMVPYITNKFDDFTANDFMRPIIGQQQSSFNFREVIDGKKILLVNLSKGRLGERNANLLGLILVGKLFMAALSRADNPRAEFPPFYLYIDEFQNITTDSIPGILSEARKYKLSLTVAHQFLAQVDAKIRDAVFGNVGSMAVFRVGQEDGEFFGKLFEPTFAAPDFTNIENRNAYVRMLAHGVPQKPFNIRTLDLAHGNLAQVDDLRELSYLTYGRDRATVEASIQARYLS